MIIVVIHWRIKPDQKNIAAFLKHWKTKNHIPDREGLIGEFLSNSLSTKDFPSTSWHLDPESSGDFKSFVTVDLWQDSDAFRKQVANYFNDDKPIKRFEKYRRRRVMFDPIARRLGKAKLPEQDSGGVR
jgi:hypothetical protein